MKLLDIMTAPWAIVPAKLQEIREVYATHMKGEKIDLKALKSAREMIAPSIDEQRGYQIDRGVAIISVDGVLTKNRTFFSYLFGGTSMRDIGDAVRNAIDDSQVHSILLRIDSPGGTVDGTEELATQIRAARQQKPVIALADGMMASAAYWIGSAADTVYISGSTTEVGSIGVVASHVDVSEQDRMFGEKYTEITAGKYKRIASMHKPLSEEGRAYIQDQVDDLYKIFVDSVAEFRGRSVEQMLEAADGKVFIGRKAVEMGLVDGISSLDEIITKLQEENSMNLEELKTKFPDVYRAAAEEGKALGVSEGVETGKTEGYAAGKQDGMKEGAEAERARIQAVEGALIEGHEDLVNSMKYDGKTTGPEAALKVIAAEKETRKKELDKIKADAITPAIHAAAPVTHAAASDNMPIDQRAKAEWDKSPDIRAEFSDNFDSYLAYEKNVAAGRIRILGRK